MTSTIDEPLNIGEATFYEKINITKLRYIINNQEKYEAIIKEQEKDMRRTDNKYNAYAVFQKIMNNCYIPDELNGTEFALIKVTYKKGQNSNNIGRWYCSKGIGLQPLCCSVRHTICEGIWLDIDQVNSHPTIFTTFMNKYGFNSPLLNECMSDREAFLAKVVKNDKSNNKLSRDEAKTKVISIINGGYYAKNETLKQLHEEMKGCIDHVINLPEYKDIIDFVKKTYTENIPGKTISRILQIIENDMLEKYIEFFNKKGLIKNNQVSLIFDGFQILINEEVTDELLEECRQSVKKSTGYDIPLKIKPFDNQLVLPENYADYEDDMPSIIQKLATGLDFFVEKNEKLFMDAIKASGSHTSIAEVTKALVKDTIVYDSTIKRWFYCNARNIWNETTEPLILRKIISSVLKDAFLICASNINKKAMNSENEEARELLIHKSATCLRIVQMLGNKPFLTHIVELKEFYLKDNFLENKIDSKPNLFAFKNKLFDFKTNTFRNIKPDDYIMTNTSYDCPEYVEDEDAEFVTTYFTTLFPDEPLRDYILDSCSSTLNGDKNEQYFNIHTGSGSNSKTTFCNLFESVLGNYACNVGAETFTKPKKSANDTGELYKAKGKRAIFTNEPESNTENKLQTALLKRIADESNQKIIARQLYANPIEFRNTCQLNIYCNTVPELSSVDNGISRRIRNIEYKVKFVDNPNPQDKYQAKKDPTLMSKMKTDGVRNAFIRMLIDRWQNRVSEMSQIPVPDEIRETTQEYVDDCNPVLGFIQQKYIISNNQHDKISLSALYTDFGFFCRDKSITSRRFKTDLINLGLTPKKITAGIAILGLKIKADEDEDEDEYDE